MKITKLCFESISDLKKVLKIPKENLIYIHPSELYKIKNKLKQIITIHLYPTNPCFKKERCLLDLYRWSYHQIYLFIYENKIYWTFGHGDTSGARESHNHMIEIFLKDKKLRNKTISAIIATFKGEIISYYFYRGYSYSNHDIGSNWDHNAIRKKLKKSKLPYSQLISNNLDLTKEIIFKTTKKKILLFKSISEDISYRKFLKKLQSERFSK